MDLLYNFRKILYSECKWLQIRKLILIMIKYGIHAATCDPHYRSSGPSFVGEIAYLAVSASVPELRSNHHVV